MRNKIARPFFALVLIAVLACSLFTPPVTAVIPSPTNQPTVVPTRISVERTSKPEYVPQPGEERSLFWPGEDLLPYDVVLPEQMNIDLEKAIWFALTNGSAMYLDETDFYHCHVLLTSYFFEGTYDITVWEGKLSDYINDIIADYSALLCHTQELDSHGLDPDKRNVIIWKGQEPYIMAPPYGESAVSPRDMDMVGAMGIEFYPSDISEITLPDGTDINVVVEYPDIYTNGFYPSQMEVDLP